MQELVWDRDWTNKTTDSDFGHELCDYLVGWRLCLLDECQGSFLMQDIAWILLQTMKVEDVVATAELIKKSRKLDKLIIIYSSYCRQYVSAEFRKVVSAVKHRFF